MDEASGEDPQGPELLAIVCEKAEEIRSRLRAQSGDDSLLEAALTAVRSGTGSAETIRLLHGYLISCGDIRGLYAFVRRGTYAHQSNPRGMLPVGVSRSGHGERIYLCPVERCARYWFRDRDSPVPCCGLSGEVLRRKRS